MADSHPMRLRGKLTLVGLAVLFAWAGGLPFVNRGTQDSLASREPSPAESAVAAFDPAPPPVRETLPKLREPEVAERVSNPAVSTGLRTEDSSDATPEVTWFSEKLDFPAAGGAGPARIEYTFDPELMRHVHEILARARVTLGHVIVLDPSTGRVLAYVSTDLDAFPPTRAYPAASLIKVVTAAATLHYAPEVEEQPCRFQGSPYRLTRSRLDPPRKGNEVSFQRALATSNNQCFAQFAVHELGRERMLDTIDRFGFLKPPGPGHEAGVVDAGEDAYGLGRMGCGLAGCRITPLHAAQMASVLATGKLVSARWIARVTDAQGHELPLPALDPTQTVMTPQLASKLRAMLIETTRTGTARKAFRTRSGRPLLGSIEVAGKTGSLSGSDPKGRYEWFSGVAPAQQPRIAIAVLVVNGELWWRSASQVAADVLKTIFCEKGVCRPDASERWLTKVQTRSP